MNRKVVTAIFALSAVLAISALAQAQSSTGQHAGLANPGFEEPRVEDETFVLVETMPGWKTTDTHFEIWGTGFKEVPAHEGTQFMELNAYIDGTLYQDSTGIQPGSVLEFTFAHRGRSGDDTMKLTITDLGADNSLDGGDDTVLFTNEYTTGNDAWAVYDSTTEQQIKALGNTVRFAYGAISTATGELGEGNLLDAANFGIGVVSMPQAATDTKAAYGAKRLHTFGVGLNVKQTDSGAILTNEMGEYLTARGTEIVMSDARELGSYWVIRDPLNSDVRAVDGWFSLESASDPGRYLRHYQFHTFAHKEEELSQIEKNLFLPDATWRFVDTSPVTMVTAGDSETNEADAAEHILTRDLEDQKGAVWTEQKIDFDENFRISAEIYLGTKDDGADGLALVFQAKGNHIVSDGGGLGYQGISPSIAIEFDTYHNGDKTPKQAVNVNNNDPVEDHVGIRADGDPVHTASDSVEVENLEDGEYHPITFEWNASQQTFNLSLDGKQIFKEKSIPENGLAGQQVYFGFTAATGGLSNEHKVRSISFSKR